MSNPKIGSDVAYDGVHGTSPNHSEARKGAYKSIETPGWDKIEVPKSQDYRERTRSGTDVPTPPTLNLP